MDHETALKHLFDDLKTKKRFEKMEYECLFQEDGNEYLMGDTLRLLFDTKKILYLSKEEFLRIPGDTVLDKLINRISDLIDIDIIRLLNAESKKQVFLVDLCVKTERLKRQEQSIYKSDKRMRHIKKEIRISKAKLTAIERDIKMFSSGSPAVKLLLLLREWQEKTNK